MTVGWKQNIYSCAELYVLPHTLNVDTEKCIQRNLFDYTELEVNHELIYFIDSLSYGLYIPRIIIEKFICLHNMTSFILNLCLKNLICGSNTAYFVTATMRKSILCRKVLEMIKKFQNYRFLNTLQQSVHYQLNEQFQLFNLNF